MRVLVARVFGITFVMALLFGCANMPKPLNTPTGRPEITFENTSVSDVKSLLTNAAMSWGYTVKEVSDYVAIYEKRDDRIVVAVLLGSRYDSTPVWRLTYNYAPIGDSIRVTANMYAVTNPGSAFERINDFSKNTEDANNLQQFLETQKAYISTGKAVATRGKVGIGFDNNLVVTKVNPGSPAEAAGLKLGDKILEIDGVPETFNPSTALKITGEPGTKVIIKAVRDSEVKTFEIMRGQP